MSALKALARFLVDLGHMTEEAAAPILTLKLNFKAEPKRPYLKSEQLDQAIRALLADPEHDPRQRIVNLALFATAALTSIRNSDQCRLKIGDLDFQTGTLTVRKGKGGKSRTLGIPDRLVPLLQLHLRQRGASARPVVVR